MLVERIKRVIEKNQDLIHGVLLRGYPAFILDNRVNDLARIPVFVFHDVTAESLEPMLRFLTDNRYATLTADEYAERQARGERGKECEVMLTFDDGYKSLYDVAYPALKRFELKAVAYIVPGVVPGGGGSSDPDTWGRSLCNWEEIQEMHESGTLDIQSHSMYHHSIPKSDRLVDFVRKHTSVPYLEPYLAHDPEARGMVGKSYGFAYGTPIFYGNPRYGHARAYRISPTVSLACIEYVDRNGGAKCFATPDWRHRLMAVMAEAIRRDTSTGLETDAEQRTSILKDLVDSKREIERRLPSKVVQHFCYPCSLGSPLAVRLSADAGYVSNAWGSLLPNSLREAQTPIPVLRFSPPYLWRLPGKGRKPLGEVFLEILSQIRWRFYQREL
jgi:hypothetical protein